MKSRISCLFPINIPPHNLNFKEVWYEKAHSHGINWPLMGLTGLSLAGGMKDASKGKAEDGASSVTEQGTEMKDAAKEQAIEAQTATKEEAGGMTDQLKEGAKGEVNKTGKTANETIDNLGK